MNLLMAPLMSFTPLFGSSINYEDSIARIEKSYDPKIEVQKIGSGWSLYGCAIEELQIIGQDPVNLQARPVKVSFYRAKVKSQKAVVILPPTGGVNILDQGYANELCSSGISVALMSGWEGQDETTLDFSMHNNGALRALSASRHATEFLYTNNYRSIGVLGTSIGAVATSLVLSFEPRITSAALIAGSARFADVVAESDEASAITLRKRRMEAYGLASMEEYKKLIREKIWVEPSHFIERLGYKPALVVTADEDTTVPSAYQMELSQMLNAKQHLKLSGNHLSVIKDTFRHHRSEIVSFFLKTLNGVEARSCEKIQTPFWRS